jgi:hypothetical protein
MQVHEGVGLTELADFGAVAADGAVKRLVRMQGRLRRRRWSRFGQPVSHLLIFKSLSEYACMCHCTRGLLVCP